MAFKASILDVILFLKLSLAVTFSWIYAESVEMYCSKKSGNELIGQIIAIKFTLSQATFF